MSSDICDNIFFFIGKKNEGEMEEGELARNMSIRELLKSCHKMIVSFPNTYVCKNFVHLILYTPLFQIIEYFSNFT